MYRRISSMLALLAASSVAMQTQAKEEQIASKFIRVDRNVKKQPINLQTSIVRYQTSLGDAGLTVDLVGAVHIGEKAYYEKLNEAFKQYDVVLYELVAPKGVRPTPNHKSNNPISMLQGMAKSMLNLESQMEHVDYSPKNFVHADMTPQEMNDAMKARGDNSLSVALDVMADLVREGNKQQQRLQAAGFDQTNQPDPLAMMFAPDRDIQLKRMMADQFASTGSLDTGMGPTLNKMLIADRNSAAIKVFQKELAKGQKKIAIFYGAAHMPDFERRLTSDFGLKPTKTTWLTAWDLKDDATRHEGNSPLIRWLSC